jgi:uncharacterized protein (DUF1697 family)
VALLRGLNVGGKNKLPMAELKAVFVDLGATDVDTYIQSGNVWFTLALAAAPALASAVSTTLAERCGVRTPVVIRSAADFAAVARAHPFAARAANLPDKPETLHVVFLAGAPAPDRAALLDPARSPPDEFELCGREIFLFAPNGLARSRLTNDYFDRTLGTVSTLRNWRTVQALAERLTRGQLVTLDNS